MRSTSVSEVADARAFFASARRSVRGFTPSGSFGEACALVVGYDWALGQWLLDEFQQWIGARHGGRSEVAFWGLVLREAFPDEATLTVADLTESQQAAAVDKLFELLDEWLAGWDPA